MPKALMLLNVEDVRSFAQGLECPILRLYLSLYSRGEMGWEQAMQAAACELSRISYLQRRVIGRLTQPGQAEVGDVLDVIRGFDFRADSLAAAAVHLRAGGASCELL